MSVNLGTPEQLRQWLKNMQYVADYQHRHLSEGRSPADKIGDAGRMLEFYLSFGREIKPDSPREVAERRASLLRALSVLRS